VDCKVLAFILFILVGMAFKVKDVQCDARNGYCGECNEVLVIVKYEFLVVVDPNESRDSTQGELHVSNFDWRVVEKASKKFAK